MSVYTSLTYQKKKKDYNRNDDVSVSVYYYYLGKKLKISTSVRIKFKDWDFDWMKTYGKNPIKKSDENYKEKNLLLKQKVKEVEDVIYKINHNYEIPTTDLVKSYLKSNIRKKEKRTFKKMDFSFILNQYKEYIIQKSTLRYGYKKTLKSNIKKIEEFVKVFQETSNYKLTINDIDDDIQFKLLDFLNSKGEQPSTIRKRFKVLSSLYNWCKLNNYTDKNFKIISFNHDNEREVIYLNRDEVLKLYNFTDFNYENSKYHKHTSYFITDNLKDGKTITYTNYEVYRDMLVFGCGVGCRYGDLVKLKLDNYHFSKDRTKGFFVFRMEKSRVGKQVKVPINNLTFQIWKKYSKNKSREDYIFPRTKQGKPIYNEKVNKSIKKIGKIVELDRLVSRPKFTIEGTVVEGSDTREPLHKFLSSHIMRRTFIREGIENKIPIHILMTMSGHTTEKVFRKYFSTTTKELDNEGKKMFTFNLGGETQNEEPKIQDNSNPSLENQLKQLKTLFDKGLIPEEVYIKKVSELL